MGNKQNFAWYLGLDIGSNSVGWSATDIEYNILTKNSKLQCGARLFEDAKDASERRSFRSLRRRLARRRVRIDLLQELFDPEVTRVDESFFFRLNKSGQYDYNDKSEKINTYPLFLDGTYCDKDYYDQFPTVYHLRQYLMKNDITDPRLLYLACHHLIKYRGHFLFENFTVNGDEKKAEAYEDLLRALNTNSIDALKQNKAIANALNGNKIQLDKIFSNDEELKERLATLKEELKDYKFGSEQYDASQVLVSEILSEEQNAYILALKSLYDRIRLDEILSGSRTVSDAMVKRYNENAADLKRLKSFVKDYLPGEYNNIFRNKGIYEKYIGFNHTHGKETVSHDKKCKTSITTIDYEDFLKQIANIIEKAKEKEDYHILKSKIDNKTLCKKLNTQDNAYIPNQLNAAELEAILSRQQRNFTFLSEEVKKNILSLLEFRIPYYVGPLRDDYDSDKFAWIVKKTNDVIRPWNFEETVDITASGERFITRMTSKCTYLKSEDVIPKQSLLYERYLLLNDLNNLKINGNRITQELKRLLLNDLCQEEASLTKARIKKYLVTHGKIKKQDTVCNENENDTAFHSSLSSFIKFRSILGEKIDWNMCENIVQWHTVFGDEKKPVIAKIRSVYGSILLEEQIIKLGKLSFNGWGRFSHKFLNELTTTDTKTGETALTILRLLEDTTMNLMEILNSEKYYPKFVDIVSDENKISQKVGFSYDSLVKELYCSPIVKRSIWQALLICQELTKINGCPPEKIFIEVTRGEDKKKKGSLSISRKKQLEALLNKCVKDKEEVRDLITSLNGKTEQEMRSDKLYLYFSQMGKCMYTGKPIDLSRLNQESLYDIDHIYPQSIIKDDSLTNRVLVCRSENANKSAIYPLNDSIRRNMRVFWEMLLSKGFINKEKVTRLISAQPLTPEQIGAFINRQLVATNQAVKETANALKAVFGDDTQIIYSKAGNVSEFRHMFDLVKCREVNNLHHAQDAYLNIVVGNEWHMKYTTKWFSTPNTGDSKLLNRLFPRQWIDQHLPKIKAYLYDNKRYLGKYPVTVRTYEKKGAFYDQTIYPKGKGQFPLHENDGMGDLSKYGGYKTGNKAYNCVIEYDGEKGRRVRGFFSVPVRFVGRYEGEQLIAKIALDDENAYKKKIADKHPKIIIPKLPIESVLEVEGIRYYMKTGDLQCPAAVEWYPDKNTIQIIHDIYKYRKLIKDNWHIPSEAEKSSMEDIMFATREKNPRAKEGKTIKRQNNAEVFDAIIKQLKKPFYANYKFSERILSGTVTKEKFMELSTYAQQEQLVGMLNSITMNGKNFKADAIGGIKTEEPVYMMKNKRSDISSLNIYLITQSITGLFEKKVVINEVK